MQRCISTEIRPNENDGANLQHKHEPLYLSTIISEI